jgi:uroporphyrinogen-III synthase
MRVIVTRPAAQAGAWVQALQALGCEAQALPLIAIAGLDDTVALRAAWQALPRYALVMFVSANAVEHFFAAATGAWPATARAGVTGPGTAAALRAAGVPPGALVEPAAGAARFDSESLWAQLAHEDWAGRQALVVRGEDGRDWLADTLRARGASVDFVAAYRRLAPQPDAAGRDLLARSLAQPAAHLWLFSSSEAVAHLRALAPGADWSRSGALATHPRIAAAARAAGFSPVTLTAPFTEAVARVIAAWPSIQSSSL